MSQKHEIRLVLVFENRDTPGMRVATELRKFTGPTSFRVLTASDLPAARQILKTQAISAVVIEVGRETGDALAALRLFGKEDQATPLYVYNGFMLPRIAEKSLEYGQVQYFEDHGNFDRFIAMILGELGKKRRGIIHGIALGSFLQLMNNEKFSGQIIVTTGEKRGALFLQGGQLVGASMNGSKNNTTLAEMSNWEKVTVEIREGQLGDELNEAQAKTAKPKTDKMTSPAAMDPKTGTGHIDILCFSYQGKKIVVNINKLSAAVLEVQGLLANALLRTDIFLSANGRSLAGWNSHPLACSAFAAITRSVQNSLHESDFPPLRNFYLFELADEHTILLMLKDELQWGLLLKGTQGHLGFLLNIVMPKALQALTDALHNQNSV
jgi:hypothetical protein